MALVTLALPSPSSLRGGWAAMSAVCAARGWLDSAYATDAEWHYHDGGGNWACLRFLGEGRAVLLGNDHEYSDTYFREAATYFQEEETNLLADAPLWWSHDLRPSPHGEWFGFIYGWDSHRWQRASYEKSDGFNAVGLLSACSITDTSLLAQFAADAPGLNGTPPEPQALQALVAAEAEITVELLQAVVPGWNLGADVAAGRKFLLVERNNAGSE